MKFYLIPALAMLLAMPVFTFAEPSEIYNAAINETSRTDDDFSRDRTSKPAEILSFAGVQPGMKILDLFAGNGYYSEILARVVGPTGKVYLHNNNAYISFVKKDLDPRLADNRLPNVVNHVRESDKMDLPPAGFDVVFMVMGFHDIFYEANGWKVDGDALMKQVRDALKPDGVLLLIDHAAVDGTKDGACQKLHRIDEAFTKTEMARHGFQLVKESKTLRNANDDRTMSVFDPKIRRRTDRFIHLYKKQ